MWSAACEGWTEAAADVAVDVGGDDGAGAGAAGKSVDAADGTRAARGALPDVFHDERSAGTDGCDVAAVLDAVAADASVMRVYTPCRYGQPRMECEPWLQSGHVSLACGQLRMACVNELHL
jgi:hypothetical protein